MPRRPVVHPVPKALSSEAILAEQAAAAAATGGDGTQGESYSFCAVRSGKKAPGPATYGSASKSFTSYQAPRATIGKEERFSSTFAGMFVRAECASELQCRDSPGPIYSPSFANMPRAPTVSWGSKAQQENVSRFKANFNAGGRDSMGPAAYHPQVQQVLPRSAQIHFGKSSRFDSFGGHAFAINNSPYTGDGGEVKVDYVRPRSAAFSFGGGRTRPPRGDDTEARSRPRTAFLTHSIRGGLARPATLECGIGPSDYTTNQSSIERNLARANPVGKGFGSAPRFARPGLVFVSAEHAKADGNVFSPGPKYAYDVNSMKFKQRQPQPYLHWTP